MAEQLDSSHPGYLFQQCPRSNDCNTEIELLVFECMLYMNNLKTWLFRVFWRMKYYPVMWRLINHDKDAYYESRGSHELVPAFRVES